MSAFEIIDQALDEVIAYQKAKARGEPTEHLGREYQVEVKAEVEAADVVEIRQKTNLSQAEFARTIGVSKGTLVNWEHRRCQPSGTARVLLAMINKKPSIVRELRG